MKRSLKSGMNKSTVNSTNGHKFEAELCEKLAEKGFWAHNFASRSEGQPADIIAVKNNTAILIDCKVCENDEFPFSRIEPNQDTAMTLFEQCGNLMTFFALKLSNGAIYMISYTTIKTLRNIWKKLKKYHIEVCDSFEDWANWIG